jgi:AcrR family transcriptional regulator
MDPRTPPDRLAGPLPARLSRAVAQLAGTEGDGRITPERIAAQAGVPTEAFHRHFASVEACYGAMHEAATEALLSAVGEAIGDHAAPPGPHAWRDALDAGSASALTFFAMDPVLARAYLVETRLLGPDAERRREALVDRFVTCLEGRWPDTGEAPVASAEVLVRGLIDVVSVRVARGHAQRLLYLLPELQRAWRGP